MNARTTNTVRLGLQKLESRESPSTINMQVAAGRVRNSSETTPAIVQNTGVKEGVGGYASFIDLRNSYNM